MRYHLDLGARIAGATIAVATVMAMATIGPASARDRAAVAKEYQISCQVCHGVRGKGDGPMASALTQKPTDLTKLEENNDYMFPYLKVFQAIDGRATIPAHGTREMPVWGRRYVEDVGETYGPHGSEAAVRARVQDLVSYVQSLQER